MRLRALALLGLLLMVVAIVPAQDTFANSDPTPQIQRTLDVTGKATMKVKPDTAMITLGASALEKTPDEAYSNIGTKMTQVVDRLKQMGVKEDDMKTGMLYLNAEYDYLQDKGQILRGYRANTTITITTQVLADVPKLIQAAVDSGANQLQGVSFTVKDTEALLDKATDEAIDNAKAKAERMAKRLGVSIVGVYKVSTYDNGSGVMIPMSTQGAEKARDSVPVLSGTNDFTVTVSVSFEIK